VALTDLDVRPPASGHAPAGGRTADGRAAESGRSDGHDDRRRRRDRLAGRPVVPASGLAGRRRSVVALLVLADALAIAVAMAVAAAAAGVIRWGADQPPAHGPGDALPALVGVGWLLTLAAQGGYEVRVLGVGGEEYRRVLHATLLCFGVLAIGSFLVALPLSRGFVALALPLGLLLLLAGRMAARRWLVRQRRRGWLCHRVLVLGERSSVTDFVAQLQLEPGVGLTVVGACLPHPGERLRDGDAVPVLGGYADVAEVARACRADVVAVTAAESITPERLRRVAWSLEGLDVDLIVAPAVTDVAGPRVTVRPVAGLPLLYVDEPRFTGWQRVAKGTIDRVGALLGLLVLAPVLLLVGLLVRLTSPGPALFRQARVGRDGRVFAVTKFRTMVDGADAMRADLDALNEGDGLLFKIESDPRVTRVGRVLRRTSIDELPQLLNVLKGEMSLVGPRPLAVDGDAFADHEQRRHLVKPGMTGLWQVSGRADQSWDDAVRLDLYYVENWSLGMDLLILMRTALVAFRGY
jgi:exopolysaccharide biosynthesis polyprenyl glycosylphosphotransferase